MELNNIILATDSYKVSHYVQYPPKTRTVYSFFESRGGDFDRILFFGLQYLIKQHLRGQVVTLDKINEAQCILDAHLGPGRFNRAGWEYILTKHGGRLPIHIRAVPEGNLYNTRKTLITVENTDPECYWLTNYLETLLVQAWYPTTVATQSFHMRQDLLRSLHLTGDPSLVDFKLHDFGYRGSTSVESSAIGAAAHLVNFMGTDTMSGLLMARDFYDATEVVGFSIPAAEHSTITSWGREHEVDAYRNMLEQYPTGLVAVVSDSFNIYEACENLWGGILKDDVLRRDGTLVVRPDSGHPPTVVVEVLKRLGSKFGYTTNAKGYKVLDPHVRVIQGDGIDRQMLQTILFTMENNGWSADNVAFGSGGGLLQKVNRDTCKFAFKCSAIDIDGTWHDVMKDPITDEGKRSRAGRFDDADLQTVFFDGYPQNTQTFAEIRQRRATFDIK